MGSSKAFVFSLDAFVAFVLTVAALYSLLFFATVPSAYYSSLMQANYLAKDTLLTLATTVPPAEDPGNLCEGYGSYLACVVSDDQAARIYIGSEIDSPTFGEGVYNPSALVPAQFGYKLEKLEFDELENIDFAEASWDAVYNTADDLDSANKKEYNKLKAAAHALYFGYETEPVGGDEAPLHYLSCGGEYTICDWPEPFVYYYDYNNSANIAIAGESDAYVVKLTVYT